MTPQKRRTAFAVLAASTLALTALSTTAATATGAPKPKPATKAPIAKAHRLAKYDAKLHGLVHDAKAKGSQAVFVQFTGKGAADAAKMAPNGRTDKATVTATRAKVKEQSDAALALAKRQDGKATRLFTVSNAVPGVGMRLDAAGITALAKQGNVVKISRIVPKTVSNANTAALVRALDTWKYSAGLGKGVRIGIIDTGLDYTHRDFGGVGTSAAYDAAKADSANPSWYSKLPAKAKTKIGGGHDFVGDDYDAAPTTDTGAPNPDYQPVPHPDENPLDCNEHGTHVAGTAAGYGVVGSGGTFGGNYANLKKDGLLKMKVGPGMAPAATLYSLKVFGCEGSTDAVIPALDWALDPNGDGDFSDHLDMVNLSLGGDYANVDDPENTVVDDLAKHGVLSVIAMGNNGDLTDTGGAPGNAVSSLAAASSVDAYQLRDGLKVNAPSALAGITAGQFSVAYDWAGNGPSGKAVTGDVVAIPGANADGCSPLSNADAAKVNGKIAWLEWDDNDATRRCGSVGRAANVAAAGAIGSIFTSKLDVFGAGITGSDTIPVIQLPKAGTDKLRPAVNAGTLKVTFDGQYQAQIKDINESISDTLSGFSSRGPHGSLGVVKPDVAAPGDTIASAAMGSGNGTLVISGTSMATPLVAGVSALAKARNPGWSPLMIKADVMNTAGHDVWTGPNKSGHKYAPARVGAGRVDALSAATNTVLAYTVAANQPVSASFGVVPAPITSSTVTRTKTVKVLNKGTKTVTVALKYQSVNSSPGVTYTVSPTTMRIGAGKGANATVTMKVTPKSLAHTIDPTMEKLQLDTPRQFVSDSSGRLLITPTGSYARRVPVYGAAKPVSMTTAKVDGQSIDFTGTGVEQGVGDTKYTSYTSVLQFGAQSGTLPQCVGGQVSGCTSTVSDRAADLQYVGAGASGDWLWFGISTRGDWANIGNTVIPYVDYDIDGDGEPDIETYVQNYPATDLLMANTVDYNTGETLDQEPVNFNWGDVDTNVFDSNVLLLPVSKQYAGLPESGSVPITYTVGTYSAISGGDVDSVGPVSFDAGTPAVATAGPLYRDAGGTAIDYTKSGSAPVKALVIHLHGADGARAQVLNLP